MKQTTRSFIIIVFNTLVLAACCYALCKEYLKEGPFQWVNPNAVEDQEEIYFLPICAALSISIALSITYEFALRYKNTNGLVIFIQKLLGLFSYLYASFLLLIGFVFLMMLLAHFNGGNFEENALGFYMLILIGALSITFMGGFIIYHIQQIPNNET